MYGHDEYGRIAIRPYCITADQLRATVKIFAEHSFLKTENKLLTNQIALLSHTSHAKDYMIQDQRAQINAMSEIIVAKDAIVANNNAMIENLKKQIVAEQKRRKYLLYGAGAGAATTALLLLFLR